MEALYGKKHQKMKTFKNHLCEAQKLKKKMFQNFGKVQLHTLVILLFKYLKTQIDLPAIIMCKTTLFRSMPHADQLLYSLSNPLSSKNPESYCTEVTYGLFKMKPPSSCTNGLTDRMPTFKCLRPLPTVIALIQTNSCFTSSTWLC